MLIVVTAAAIGRSCSAGIKADVESSSKGIFDDRTKHSRSKHFMTECSLHNVSQIEISSSHLCRALVKVFISIVTAFVLALKDYSCPLKLCSPTSL